MNWLKQIYYRYLAKKFDLPNSVVIESPAQEDAFYEAIFTVGAGKKESKNWKEFRPEYERQGYTGDCVSFSRTSCAEYVALKDGYEINLSDLHLAVGSNTSPRGNSLNAPSEYFRKKGVVEQGLCFYDADMITKFGVKKNWARRQQKVNAIPKNAKRYKGGNHSWVVTRKDSMIDALEHSPLQIAIGLGQNYRYGGTVKKPSQILAYHAVVLEHIDEEGRFHIFDSLVGETKILEANYPIVQCKSFRDLPQLWKKKQREYPIFYKERNGNGVYLYGLGSGKYYLIPNGKMFNDLFGSFGQSLIIDLPIRTLRGYSGILPSENGGKIKIEK